tara:strand:- start:1225 stop:2118 length:894 start_codon:yes stop_codon:yes gene_type:complete
VSNLGRRRDWTVLQLIEWSGQYLEEKGVERGRLDAEHLLAHAMSTTRLDLYLQYDRLLSGTELDQYRPLLTRRARREPLQYIVGRSGFRNLELEVDQAVLIPRPETEILVDEVLQWVSENKLKKPVALDIGTGSGAIALSLVHEGPFSRVVATDTSRVALEVATRNSLMSGLSDRVDFRLGKFYEPLTAGEVFEVIVSNPPYIADGEAEDLDPEIREWEPGAALYAGPDGLAALRRIVTGAGPYLKPGGLLALEVGLGQATYIMELLENTGEFRTVRVCRDLNGRERVVLAHGEMTD